MKIRHKFIVLVLSTLLLSGCNSDYKLSAVSCITKSEAVEFIVNALKSDPSIPTFNVKQGTVEGYEVIETEETDNSLTGGTDVTLGEDDYKGEDFEEASPEETPAEQPTVDTTGKTNVVVQDGITYWDGITDEEIAQQIIDQFERENGIGKYAPGSDPSNYIMPEGAEHGTPGDPSQDGTTPFDPNIDLPDHLKGRHTN